MKSNQSRPGFEFVSPSPFPSTITITPRAPPKTRVAVSISCDDNHYTTGTSIHNFEVKGSKYIFFLLLVCPLVDTLRSPTYIFYLLPWPSGIFIYISLARWLIQVLIPVLTFYSGFCVDDSFTFSSMIHQLLPCVDSQFMVSFDIISLFTNVPLDEVISICADFLYQSLHWKCFPGIGGIGYQFSFIYF